MDLPFGSLKTTVVGSFPLPYSIENVHRALSDQVEAGINFPCYGQLKDMCLMFLEPLAEQGCGIEVKNGEARITGPLRPPEKPIALEYLKLAQDFLKNNSPEWIDGVKAPITGPITLASVTKVSENHTALEYPDFILGFADIVARIAKWYDEAGAGIVTIDEPSLGYAAWLGIEKDVLIEAIDKPISSIKKAISSIHACGDISTVADILIQTKAPMFDHSFKEFSSNLGAYSKAILEKADKMIGFGCVRPVPDPQLLMDIKKGKRQWMEAVESVDEIEKLIREGGKRFGLERLMILPDCGFRGLGNYFEDDTGQKIVVQKLKNMVAAAKRVRGS